MDFDKIKIVKGIRYTKITFKIETKQYERIIEEGLDTDLYPFPISKKDFEERFNFDEEDKQLSLFDIEILGKEIH